MGIGEGGSTSSWVEGRMVRARVGTVGRGWGVVGYCCLLEIVRRHRSGSGSGSHACVSGWGRRETGEGGGWLMKRRAGTGRSLAVNTVRTWLGRKSETFLLPRERW